jgi:hypothetical protein
MRGLAVSGAILVLVALTLFAASTSDQKRIAKYGDKPVSIPLQSLVEQGERGPKFVSISEFVPCDLWIVEADTHIPAPNEVESQWQRAYVPLTFFSSQTGQVKIDTTPDEAAAIVRFPDARDEEDVARRCAGPELVGVVRGPANQLDEQTRKLILSQFPKTDLSRCLVITEGEGRRLAKNPLVGRNLSILILAWGFTLFAVAGVVWSIKRITSRASP